MSRAANWEEEFLNHGVYKRTRRVDAPALAVRLHVAFDPDGHCIQIYHYMEQVGWEGNVKPDSKRRSVEAKWPETLDALPDSFQGEAYLGPWG